MPCWNETVSVSQGKAIYLLCNHPIYMNIHRHLVKHNVLDYEALDESCTGNTSFFLSGLLNREKIQGSEFRPYRTFIQTIKIVIWQLRVWVVSHHEDLILGSQWMQKMSLINSCIPIPRGMYVPFSFFLSSPQAISRGCQTAAMKPQNICPEES